MSRTVAIITGSRAEYRYIRPVIRKIEARPGLDFELIVTNQHLLPEFGNSIGEIERDGIPIAERIYMAVDGYTPETMCKSLALFQLALTDSLARLKPDILMVVGDRGEHLIGAMVGAHLNIPVAHIQAGERSGNIDGMTRHAIGRFAHLHFAANEDAVERLRRSGEEEFRIHLTGAPQLDDLVQGEFMPREEVAKALDLDLAKPVIFFVMHAVTEEYADTRRQMEECLRALALLEMQTIVMAPNSDAGHDDASAVIEQNHRPFMRIERNLPDQLHAGLLRVAGAIVGNSSSGIIEAPALRLPAVNIGSRQRDRYRGSNVIDVEARCDEIVEGVRRALSPECRNEMMAGGCDPYLGDRRVSERIVEALASATLDETLLKKQITY